MSREYSKEQLKKFWDPIKPSEKEIEKLEITRYKTEITEIKRTMQARNSLEVFPLLDILREKIRIIEDRLDGLEFPGSIGVSTRQEEIELRVIPEEEAISLISDYVAKHPGRLTSDIIFDLELDPDLVLKILKKLEKSKKVRGTHLEPK